LRSWFGVVRRIANIAVDVVNEVDDGFIDISLRRTATAKKMFLIAIARERYKVYRDEKDEHGNRIRPWVSNTPRCVYDNAAMKVVGSYLSDNARREEQCFKGEQEDPRWRFKYKPRSRKQTMQFDKANWNEDDKQMKSIRLLHSQFDVRKGEKYPTLTENAPQITLERNEYNVCYSLNAMVVDEKTNHRRICFLQSLWILVFETFKPCMMLMVKLLIGVASTHSLLLVHIYIPDSV